MEIIVVEETPKKLIFELKGEGNTVLNALKNTLWQNKHVKVATYSIEHPLVGVPKMIVETDGEVKPRKALLEAAEKLQKDADKLKKDLAKIKV
jgi:DNA-directed RNA polymerase subunit L